VLIGLTGFARTGKDTTADFMTTDFGFTKFSFADPMREALVRLDPTIHVGGHPTSLASAVNLMGWEELKGASSDVRPLLQRFGTEVGRNMFGQNFWVDLALKSIADVNKAVFADVRFKNEADAIKAAGGIVIRITRPEYGPANSHISELEMVDYPVDFTINNSSNLFALKNEVNSIINSISEA
jgi:hypothetical protein